MITAKRCLGWFSICVFGSVAVFVDAVVAGQFNTPVPFPDPFSSSQNGVVSTNEPSIRVAPNGAVYIGAIRGVPSGIDIWQFHTDSNTAKFVASPDTAPFVISPIVTIAIGGGDMDLQPTIDGKLTYSSLWAGSLTVGASTGLSLDGQTTTFASQPLGSVIVGDDRQWMAADPSGSVYMSFHDGVGNIDVVHSPGGPVAGLVYLPAGAVFGPTDIEIGFNQHGNIVADKNGRLYQVYAYGSTTGATGMNAVGVATSTDGGLTWTKTNVYVDSDTSKNFATLFPAIAVNDPNVYVVFSDGNHVYAGISNNGGTSFGSRFQVDGSMLNASLMPWVAAGSNGADVVWYGTKTSGGNSSSAVWDVYMQQLSTTGLSGSNLAADTAVKQGTICIAGLSCDLPGGSGGRELGDFFQVAVDGNGLADIAYTKVDAQNKGEIFAVHQTSDSIGAP